MKNIKTEIKNKKFHQQLGGEKIKAMTVILLLSFNDTIVYDIVCNFNCEQLKARIAEIDNNNIRGVSYIAITNSNSFIEYKRVIMK